MMNIHLFKHSIVSMDEIEDGSISIRMARNISSLGFKHPKQETSVSTNWEEFYEKRYYKRSHKRHRVGLSKVAELCQTILDEKDKYLLEEDSQWENDLWKMWKKAIDKKEDSRKNLNPENKEQDIGDDGLQLLTEVHQDDNVQADDEMGIHDDVEGADLDRLESPDGDFVEPAVDHRDDKIIQNPDGDFVEPALDQPDDKMIKEHYVTTERFGDDGMIVHVICSCGARFQLLLSAENCYYMITPLSKDVSGREDPKLVWVSESPNQVLPLQVGLDCPCGHGFLFKKLGHSLSYCME